MPRIAYAKVAPEAYKALLGVASYIETGSIDTRLRALVETRISQINGCLYCLDMHAREARDAGETQHRLDCLAAWHEASFFTDREKAALGWAESVTRISKTGAPDSAFDLLKPHFSEKEIVDLTMIVAMMNMWNRIAICFRQDPPTRKEG